MKALNVLVIIGLFALTTIAIWFFGFHPDNSQIDTIDISSGDRFMKITSTAFNGGGNIPSLYTCDGEDINPPFVFEAVPENTESLVLIMDDPDSPSGSANPGWIHWLIYNINPTDEIIENDVPNGALQGVNDWGKTEYGGPCPHTGRHHYYHTVYALDNKLDFPSPPTKSELLKAMDGHILASAELIGLYTLKD